MTLAIDEAAFHGELRLPSWVISGSPDAARQILSSLAGALIHVVRVLGLFGQAVPSRRLVLAATAGDPPA